MRKDYYVYEHRQKDTGRAFYVGKGCGNRAFRRYGHNPHWERIVEKHGYYAVLIFEGLTSNDACDLEIMMIAAHGRENLCNLTGGGEGVISPSKETRKKMRDAKIGGKLSEEHKSKISKAGVGRKMSPEAVQKIRKWHLENPRDISGEKHPMYGILGKDNPNYGKKRTPEQCKNISDGLTGRKLSDEHRMKISEVQKGKRTGSDNNMYNHTSYHFHHEDYGNRMCTMNELCVEFNYKSNQISRICSGVRGSYKGWVVLNG